MKTERPPLADKMVIADTQFIVVHREAVIGGEEFKRSVSPAELLQPSDDGLPYETSIESMRRPTQVGAVEEYSAGTIVIARCEVVESDAETLFGLST